MTTPHGRHTSAGGVADQISKGAAAGAAANVRTVVGHAARQREELGARAVGAHACRAKVGGLPRAQRRVREALVLADDSAAVD